LKSSKKKRRRKKERKRRKKEKDLWTNQATSIVLTEREEGPGKKGGLKGTFIWKEGQRCRKKR